MTDSRLRALERRWKESGSVEDEAAYLRERVRVGDIDQETLELVSRLGHEAAQMVCPQQFLPFDQEDLDSLQEWIEALHQISPRLAGISAMLAVEHVLTRVEHIYKERYLRIFRAARKADFTDLRLGDWVSWQELSWSDQDTKDFGSEDRHKRLPWAIRTALRANSGEDIFPNSWTAISHCSRILQELTGETTLETEGPMFLLMKQVVSAKLVRYLLGYHDPDGVAIEEQTTKPGTD